MHTILFINYSAKKLLQITLSQTCLHSTLLQKTNYRIGPHN